MSPKGEVFDLILKSPSIDSDFLSKLLVIFLKQIYFSLRLFGSARFQSSQEGFYLV